MNNQQLRQGPAHIRLTGLNAFEAFCQKWAGWMDGERELPRNTGDGEWTSPHMEKELSRYRAYTARLWGGLQIDRKADFIRLGTLSAQALRELELLQAARAAFASAAQKESERCLSERKPGEEGLPEALICARRQREGEKRLEPYAAAVDAAQKQLSQSAQDLNALYTDICININAARMTAAAARERTVQRLNCYWRAAMDCRNAAQRLISHPYTVPESRAEADFMKDNEALFMKAKAICEALQDMGKETV